jgi:transcriptional regulator with XRE-family HTH domain
MDSADTVKCFFMNPLREIRQKRGFSLRELAKRSGVGISTIGNYETGRGNASSEILKKLAAVLRVSPSEIRAATMSPSIMTVINSGPSVAAKKMTDSELVKRIKQHAVELGRADEYMRGAHAEIVAALALEMYHRSRLGQLRERIPETKRKSAPKKS